MAKNRVSRKQLLNEPDEFITTANRLIEWAKENTRLLVAGAGAFLAVAVLVSVFGYYRQARSEAAETPLGQGLATYQTTLGAKDPAAALAAVRNDFDALSKSYGTTPAGRLGAVIYGNICIAGQDYDDAIVNYEKSLTVFGADSSLSNVILSGLGTAYQQKGDYNRAVFYYKQVADGAGSLLKDVALFNLGRLYGQLGKNEESRKANERLEVEFPQSMYANLVK